MKDKFDGFNILVYAFVIFFGACGILMFTQEYFNFPDKYHGMGKIWKEMADSTKEINQRAKDDK